MMFTGDGLVFQSLLGAHGLSDTEQKCQTELKSPFQSLLGAHGLSDAGEGWIKCKEMKSFNPS